MIRRSGVVWRRSGRKGTQKAAGHKTLGYPKYTRPKRRKRHKASIIQPKDGRCYLCMMLRGDNAYKPWLHEHHIFGGPRRKKSEAEGLKVYLCPEHHELIHHSNILSLSLKRTAQAEYEKTHTRQEFMNLMGKNYLIDEETP